MKYFIGTYSNGYCGCDEEVYLIADTEEQVAEYLDQYIDEYGYDAVMGTDYEDDEDNAAYWAEVTYDIREATQEEISWIDADSWIDIRNT